MFTQDEVQIIEGINQIPIFNIENVRGKCIAIPKGVQALVLADDIAKEGGLTRENPITYIPKQNSEFLHKSVQKIHTLTFDNKLSKTYEYINIMWSRFNQYTNDAIPYIQKYNPSILQYLPSPIKSGSYIPLEVALVVLMRLNSKKAQEFRVILATRIAPELTNNAIQVYQQQLLEYQQQLQMQQEQLQYYQNFIDTSTVYSTTEVAREFAMSPQQLRQILQNDFHIIYPCNKTWQISQHLAAYDFVRNKAINNNNIQDHPYWTDSGRQFVINLLRDHGYQLHRNNPKLIVPLVFDNYIHR